LYNQFLFIEKGHSYLLLITNQYYRIDVSNTKLAQNDVIMASLKLLSDFSAAMVICWLMSCLQKISVETDQRHMYCTDQLWTNDMLILYL